MSTKRTNKRKRGKAARQRRKLMITGGLAVLLVVVIIIGVFFLGGCSNGYEADTNTVYVLENGKVVSSSVESFDEEAYSKDTLKSYVKELVNTYNAEHEKAVKQKSLKVKDGKAVLVMEYANADVYEDFEGTEFFAGSIADAVAAGYTFDGEFANVADGKVMACTAEEFMNDAEYQVVIIKSNVTVSVENHTICYVSSENTASVENGEVVIKAGANLLATASVEDTEAVESTEIEGAITEDELLLETEQEIVFDFGEEEEGSSQYSSVYTYIIYK